MNQSSSCHQYLAVYIICTYIRTRVNFEVHPEVAGITEGLTAVFTLVRFHPHMPHEVHIELSDCDECPGAHAAFILLLTRVTMPFSPDSDPSWIYISAPPAVITV